MSQQPADLRDLLQAAAGQPRLPVEPERLRTRADRRRRRRIGVLTAVAILLVALPALLLQTAPAPRVLLDADLQPQVSPAATTAALDVHLEAMPTGELVVVTIDAGRVLAVDPLQVER